jgi:L-arabinose isomerase
VLYLQTLFQIYSVSTMKSFDTINQKHRVGLFSVGLEAYWDQYPDLHQRLESNNITICRKIEALGVEVVNVGLVDSHNKAVAAGHFFRQEDVDLLFLHVSTYALSATVLPVLRRAKTPVVLLNLAPEAAIEYSRFNQMDDRTKMTGEWLAYCQSCSVPEIANVFRRCRIPFQQLTGVLDEERVWREIGEWLDASRVAYGMEHNRLGVMGHYYSGMLDIYSDLTLQSSTFGTHVEIIEVDELSALRREPSATEIAGRVAEIRRMFDVEPACSQGELECAARTSVALDRLVERHSLGSLAYYYKGTGVAENEDTVRSIIAGTSMLTARGIPVAGELEIKNVQAMKILDLFGVGGSFTEFYAIDFNDDTILMGHDGPGHMAIAEGKPRLRRLNNYHGKVGNGLSIEMSVKHGPVTLLAIAEMSNNTLKFVAAEGESISGPTLEIGNTNSRYRFPLGVRGFIQHWSAHGSAHHCAIAVGHHFAKLEKLAFLMGIECVRVC